MTDLDANAAETDGAPDAWDLDDEFLDEDLLDEDLLDEDLLGDDPLDTLDAPADAVEQIDDDLDEATEDDDFDLDEGPPAAAGPAVPAAPDGDTPADEPAADEPAADATETAEAAVDAPEAEAVIVPEGPDPSRGRDHPELNPDDTLGAAATLPGVRSEEARAQRRAKRRRRVRLPTLEPRRLAIVVTVVVFGLALIPYVMAGFAKTPKDKIGLSYGGGLFEANHFQKVVEPGSDLFFNGWADKLYLYPAGEIVFLPNRAVGKEGEVATELSGMTSDGTKIDYEVMMYFTLNRSTIRDFHERLGHRFKADTGEGWLHLLNSTIGKQFEPVLQSASLKVTSKQIASDPELLERMSTEVETALNARLTRTLGGPYFCSPQYREGQPCGDVRVVINAAHLPALYAETQSQQSSGTGS